MTEPDLGILVAAQADQRFVRELEHADASAERGNDDLGRSDRLRLSEPSTSNLLRSSAMATSLEILKQGAARWSTT